MSQHQTTSTTYWIRSGCLPYLLPRRPSQTPYHQSQNLMYQPPLQPLSSQSGLARPNMPRLLPSWLHKSLVQSQFNFSVCSVHSCLPDRHHLTNLCQIQVHLWEELLHSLPLHVQLLVLVPWQMQHYCGLLGLPFVLLQFLFLLACDAPKCRRAPPQLSPLNTRPCPASIEFVPDAMPLSPSVLQAFSTIIAFRWQHMDPVWYFPSFLLIFWSYFLSICMAFLPVKVSFFDAFDLSILCHWYLFHSYSCMCFALLL